MSTAANPRLCPCCGVKQTRGLCAACRKAQRDDLAGEADGRHSHHKCRESAKFTQFRRLWENYSAMVYGADRPPYEAEWWFYCGATALLDVFGAWSAATPFPSNAVTDAASAEYLRRLMNEVHNDFRRIGLESDSPAEPLRDRKPN